MQFSDQVAVTVVSCLVMLVLTGITWFSKPVTQDEEHIKKVYICLYGPLLMGFVLVMAYLWK